MEINEENLEKQRALKQSHRTKKSGSKQPSATGVASGSRHEKQPSIDDKGKKRPREEAIEGVSDTTQSMLI
jgi:hypothetical protein